VFSFLFLQRLMQGLATFLCKLLKHKIEYQNPNSNPWKNLKEEILVVFYKNFDIRISDFSEMI
jgi:hypothetical protein